MEPLRLVCFELRGQELALPIGEVRETLPVQPITRVFLTPPALAGVFSLRGEIIPVIDLGLLLGLPPTQIGDDSRIVVVEPDGAAGIAGIVVDRLRDVRALDDAPGPVPPSIPANVAAMLSGVALAGDATVRILNAAAVLTAELLRPLAAKEATP
ncbi:MAG TPA: chemotaxis protein CheW [Kofleriaceae bacterium]|jgi:purine-binding chemotaxis protein CheW